MSSKPTWKFSLSASPFILIILGFFMVFTEINCNGETLTKLTGYDLVTGVNDDLDAADDGETEPSIWAIVSLIAAASGILFLAIRNEKKRLIAFVAMGIIGLTSMILLYNELHQGINAKMDENDSNATLNVDMSMVVEMKFGYWFVLGLFTLTTVWNGWLLVQKPPKTPDLT